MEAWRLNAGDTRDVDGVSVTVNRVNRYWTAIKKITELSGKSVINEPNVDDARKYMQDLQRSTMAVQSQRQRLGLLKELFKIAIQYGYANSNPFGAMAIRISKGAELDTYRPFAVLSKNLYGLTSNKRTEIVPGGFYL